MQAVAPFREAAHIMKRGGGEVLGAEISYFPCCIPAYDSAIQKVDRATASILKKAEVNFIS